jgi:ribosomal protein L23
MNKEWKFSEKTYSQSDLENIYKFQKDHLENKIEISGFLSK